MKEEIQNGTLATRDRHNWRNADSSDVKSCLQSKISLAVEQEKERIIKLIKEKGLHLGYANNIIDLINCPECEREIEVKEGKRLIVNDPVIKK